uniref:Integrase catalytic domain-containing protein n=1 Tax=Chromera velia CCMP2878 TaxID=1169474 RepID=A0A0G4HCI5_9ALVE|eukprot:Cvel_6339.t1-p1 / transcript=Cvel_6339.t1 / gene=Cvel_6339 / organism=Chromera_velia_CCMP2878 / gene_product=Retrovirus-related Pol polyprotein from transposon, putative / transcript_product=Retrovirus-related Pol polyprotein from transposon, putative / location=Cvel_scaffold307:100381-101595(+) / protein_length=405 / sequence_SO=supercontig / SO=protein_coding / is_pseudo=false
MSRRGNRFMLVITCALTRWPEVFALPEVPTWKVVKILFEEIICWYRFIQTFVSDRGTNFLVEIVQELLKLVKAYHLTTTSYHPQGNVIPERFNQTLVQGLGKQVNEERRDSRGDWDLYLQPFLASYRTTGHAETGYSPFGLVFAHNPQSILRVTPVPEGARAPRVCYDEYAGFIRQQRIERVDRARRRAEREKQTRERRNPSQMTEKFRVGDRVLLRKPTPNLGKQPKFVMKFEEGQTFVVVAVPHDRPHVAVIRPLGGKERDVISTDRLMLWQPAKRVERETEERASAVEKERGERIPPGTVTPKSSFRVGEDPDKDNLLDELGLGDELEVEKEEVKESSAGNKKRGKPQPTRILAVREKEGTEEYRVSFDNGTFAWMPEEKVQAPNLVRDFEKEKERVTYQVN